MNLANQAEVANEPRWWEFRQLSAGMYNLNLTKKFLLPCLGTKSFHCCSKSNGLAKGKAFLCSSCQLVLKDIKKKRQHQARSCNRSVQWREGLNDGKDLTSVALKYGTEVRNLLEKAKAVVCSTCHRDVDDYAVSDSEICSECHARLQSQILSAKLISSTGYLGPLHVPLDREECGSTSKRFLVCLLGRSDTVNSEEVPPNFGLVGRFATVLTEQPRAWTENGEPMLPIQSAQVQWMGNYHGVGPMNSSMLAKTSHLTYTRPFASISSDIGYYKPTDEDCVLLAASHPENFGTGNPLYVLEFLLSLQANVSLERAFLVFLGYEFEESCIINALLLVNCGDLARCLQQGVFPAHKSRSEHLLRLLKTWSLALPAPRQSYSSQSIDYEFYEVGEKQSNGESESVEHDKILAVSGENKEN
ncbi:hypothetical protein MP228_008051 [Amoeboaphelidium protococcarum]|nr:hypothetical protein MP228_008051 [Amoeboaphelidium protococcarum]